MEQRLVELWEYLTDIVWVKLTGRLLDSHLEHLLEPLLAEPLAPRLALWWAQLLDSRNKRSSQQEHNDWLDKLCRMSLLRLSKCLLDTDHRWMLRHSSSCSNLAAQIDKQWILRRRNTVLPDKRCSLAMLLLLHRFLFRIDSKTVN